MPKLRNKYGKTEIPSTNRPSSVLSRSSRTSLKSMSESNRSIKMIFNSNKIAQNAAITSKDRFDLMDKGGMMSKRLYNRIQ